MSQIRLATVLLGATGFTEGNVNETFRGTVLTEDGVERLAIIKDLNLVQLCNELIVYCLACEADLPIPDCYLGRVPPGILSVSNAPKFPDGSSLVFVSVDVKVPNVTYRWTGSDDTRKRTLVGEIAKWNDLGQLYAFDSWVANVDRNTGNLLFGGDNEYWLIDHGHCFTGPSWQPENLDPDVEYLNKLSLWVTQFLTTQEKKKCAKAVREFGAEIDGFDASEAPKNSRVDKLLPLHYVDKLKQFLEKRTARVSLDASKALGVPQII